MILAARVFAPFLVSLEKRLVAGLDVLRGAVNYQYMFNHHTLDGLETI